LLLCSPLESRVPYRSTYNTKTLQFVREFELWRRIEPKTPQDEDPSRRVALALSCIKGDKVNNWVFQQIGILTRKVEGVGTRVPPTHHEDDEDLWEDFINDFGCAFTHTA
jgi:hypothetical protein